MSRRSSSQFLSGAGRVSQCLRCSAMMVGALFLFAGCGDGNPDPNGLKEDGGKVENPGKKVFEMSLVHEIEIEIAVDDWQAIIDEAAVYVNNNPARPYYRAKVSFDDEKLDGDVGLRLKGHISIELSKNDSFPLKLDFNRYVKGLALDGLKKLNLNTNFDGPSLPIVRDYLSYNAWRDFGVSASRTSFARVSVNGKDLGVYTLVEQVDGDFIKRNFDAPRGDLYKPEQESGNLHYQGSAIANYSDIGHKWPDESDHASLLKALSLLDTKSGSDLAQVFDVKGVLTYMAGNVVLGSGDYYAATGHNYYLYEKSPGQFTMLPWDMNGSQEPMAPKLCSPQHGLLSQKLLENPTYEKMYFDLVSKFLETAGSESSLNKQLDTVVSVLGSAISAEDVKRMREDIASRVKRLEGELKSTSSCAMP